MRKLLFVLLISITTSSCKTDKITTYQDGPITGYVKNDTLTMYFNYGEYETKAFKINDSIYKEIGFTRHFKVARDSVFVSAIDAVNVFASGTPKVK